MADVDGNAFVLAGIPPGPARWIVQGLSRPQTGRGCRRPRIRPGAGRRRMSSLTPDPDPEWDINQTIIWIIYRGSPAPDELSDEDVSSALRSVNNAVRTSKLEARGRPSPHHRSHSGIGRGSAYRRPR